MKLTGLATLITALTCSVFSAEPLIEKLDLFKAGDGGCQLYHIPGVVVTAQGTVLAWCEARPGVRSPEVWTLTAR